MNDIMLDLETLGNGSNAVIIAIGAVQFNHGGLGKTFYTTVDPQSCVDLGMKMDVSTVVWWMQQSNEARSAFSDTGLPILGALHNFSDFVRDCVPDGNAKVWGNGAAFDNVVLSNAYRVTSLKQPWSFWDDRCYRTLKNLYPHIVPGKIGVAHNALDDAISQAWHASRIMKYLKETTWWPA